MSKRVTITLADEHYACLVEIAKQNNLAIASTAYMMMDEWMQNKALQFELAEQINAAILDAAATGTPN